MSDSMRGSCRSFVATSAILVALLAGSCAQPPAEPVAEPEPAFDAAAEAEVIMALERQWSEKLGADDVDWIMDLHAAGAWQLPANAEPINDREALRAAWQGMAQTEGLEISWESTLARVSESGDMAWDLGSVTITNPDGSVVPAKYLVVWTREKGRWKVAADMFSPNVGP